MLACPYNKPVGPETIVLCEMEKMSRLMIRGQQCVIIGLVRWHASRYQVGSCGMAMPREMGKVPAELPGIISASRRYSRGEAGVGFLGENP